jgi:hypothetical protein
MSGLKRTRDAIDMLEHAMQGVHTSNDHKIISFSRDAGLIGTRSTVEIESLDDTPQEREVVVRIPRQSRTGTR